MDYLSYEIFVRKTAKCDPKDRKLLAAMGLSGEAGEVLELFKKHIVHGKKLDRNKLCDEMGDVLWYFTLMLLENGLSLEEVMHFNRKKLTERHTKTPEHYDATKE